MNAAGQHEARTAAWLGAALGVAFTTCFATGVYSHLLQNEPSWLDLPARPAGLYRITQTVHVITGFASIPLLLAKLWTVSPHLVRWPPVRSVAHAVERLALLPLVGGSLFLLVSGTANVARWYPWGFSFPRAHFWVAWITIGGLVTHIGAKWSTTRAALAPVRGGDHGGEDPRDRRAFLTGVAATSGIVAVVTAGGSVPSLGALGVLSQRRPGVGPQGIPVNRSAAGAGVEAALADLAGYRLRVEGAVTRPLVLTLSQLRSLPQRSAELPIQCVEGWSASARWTGVPVRELLALAGAADGAEVVVESLQRRGSYRSSELNRHHAADRDTLLALELNGEPLHPDHGFPVRLIGPNRPGVMQTKWVSRLVVR